MQDVFMNRRLWARVLLFLMACTFSFIGVLGNHVELVLLAALDTAVLFWMKPDPSLQKGEINTPEATKITADRLVITASLVFYALLAAGVTIYLARTYPNSLFTLATWAVSILLLLAAGMVYDRIKPFQWVRRLNPRDLLSRQNLLTEILPLLLVTAVALVLRVYDLNHYPPMMHGDEGEIGMVALRFLGRGDPMALFGTGWADSPTLLVLFQVVSMFIFGQNEVGLRLASALAGTACVPLVYLIGRKGWGKLAGFFAAWLMAVSDFYIHYSRIAIGVIESTFFFLLFLLLLLLPFFPQRSQTAMGTENTAETHPPSSKTTISLTLLICTGVVFGLALYSYFGVRFLTPVLAAILYFYLWIRKRITLPQIAVVGLVAALVFAPAGFALIQSPQQLLGRVDTVSIFNPGSVANSYGPGVSWPKNAFFIISSQFTRNVNTLMQSGDSSGFYFQGIPLFDLLTAMLFWLGLGAMVARMRRFPELVMVTWFVLGFILGGMLTGDSPQGSRLLIVYPPVFIMGGVFVQLVWDEIKAFFQGIPDLHLSPVWLTAPLFCFLLLLPLGMNLHDYFVVYAANAPSLTGIYLAREINADESKDHVYLLGAGEIYSSHGVIRFIAGVNSVTDLQQPSDLPKMVKDGKGVTVLATGTHFEDLKQIQAQYPNGTISEYKDPIGRYVYMKYHIPPLP